MCLLLTLLAVPVFYSLFDDAQQSNVWRGASGRFAGLTKIFKPVREKLADVFSLFTRKKNESADDSAEDLGDDYVEQNSNK